MPPTKQKPPSALAKEFVDYLFNDAGGQKEFVRLVLAERGQFAGYNGWSRDVILERLDTALRNSTDTINALTALEHQSHRQNHEFKPGECSECTLTLTLINEHRERLHLDPLEFTGRDNGLPVSQQFQIAAVNALNELTNDERAEVFARYCVHCGSNDPTCQCWNDE